MSVISNWPATPNRVKNIYLRLQQVGEQGEPIDTLLLLFSPPTLQLKRGDADEDNESSSPKTPMGNDVLEESKRLGIVEKYSQQEDNIEYLRLTEPLLSGKVNLLTYLEEALLLPEVANTLGQKNFPKIMAWFLMQEGSKPFSFSAMPTQEIRAMFGEERIAANTNASMQNFYYWARYLGFSWWIESKSYGKMIHADPAVFLERHLPDLLRGQGEVPLRDLMAGLAQRYPFFEGGTLRDELEELIPERRKLLPNELASSTSLALKCLQQKGVIHLKNLADAPKMTLLTWPQAEQFSHIILAHKDV